MNQKVQTACLGNCGQDCAVVCATLNFKFNCNLNRTGTWTFHPELAWDLEFDFQTQLQLELDLALDVGPGPGTWTLNVKFNCNLNSISALDLAPGPGLGPRLRISVAILTCVGPEPHVPQPPRRPGPASSDFLGVNSQSTSTYSFMCLSHCVVPAPPPQIFLGVNSQSRLKNDFAFPPQRKHSAVKETSLQVLFVPPKRTASCA